MKLHLIILSLLFLSILSGCINLSVDKELEDCKSKLSETILYIGEKGSSRENVGEQCIVQLAKNRSDVSICNELPKNIIAGRFGSGFCGTMVAGNKGDFNLCKKLKSQEEIDDCLTGYNSFIFAYTKYIELDYEACRYIKNNTKKETCYLQFIRFEEIQ